MDCSQCEKTFFTQPQSVSHRSSEYPYETHREHSWCQPSSKQVIVKHKEYSLMRMTTKAALTMMFAAGAFGLAACGDNGTSEKMTSETSTQMSSEKMTPESDKMMESDKMDGKMEHDKMDHDKMTHESDAMQK
ncbi:hypothetical protein CDHC02_0105 [Corynebacterium diphtheriae HC02]|nr:hypothetical protein CDB402_0065 [Corynebacterium diphtheriae INCA 402]AEX75601.1 hypothetical protein CDHC02_0105 [Corynebacterium diphtheriae HC02]